MDTTSDPALRPMTTPHSSPPSSDRVFATSIVDVWWVGIPAKLRRHSPMLWAAWSDGMYLSAWPRAAVVLPIAALLFGFFEGVTRWTFVILGSYGPEWGITYSGHGSSVTVFAELLPLLVLASFLGGLSANLGLMLAIGYAIGDFISFNPPWSSDDMLHRVLLLHVPQLICFVLFLLLSVWPAVATKFLVASAHPRLRSQPDRIQVLITAAVLGAFVYEWTYFAPMLFRVAWVWPGIRSPLTVVLFHKYTMPLLVIGTIAGVLLRYWFSLRAEQKALAALQVRATALAAQARITPGAGAPWLRAILGAAYLTLLIAGFLDSVVMGAVIFGGMAAFFLARTYVLREVWSDWSRFIVRYPTLLRLAVGVAGTWVITRVVLILPGMGAAQNAIPGKFGAEVLCLLLGFLLVSVLLPNGVLTLDENAHTGSGVRLPVSQVAVQAGTFIALMLLVSKRALAQGPCNDPSCCFQGNNAAAAAATAAAVASAFPGLSGIAGAAGAAAADVAASKSSIAEAAQPQGPPAPPSATQSGSPESDGASKSAGANSGSGLGRDAWVGFGGIAGALIGGLIGTALTSETGPGAVAGGIAGADYGKDAGVLLGGFVGGLAAGGAYDGDFNNTIDNGEKSLDKIGDAPRPGEDRNTMP